MRAIGIAAVVVLGCASAGVPGVGGDDTGGGDDTPPVDALDTTDAAIPGCADDDGDTVCNAVDTCPGHPDTVDADLDTIADGCDRCAGADDRPDVNANQTPDCLEYVMRTIPLKQVGSNLGRGWHATTGGHSTTNENTLTGQFGSGLYNSYFIFPITGFTATSIQSVTLQLQLEMYSSGDATETLSVWDVTTPSATVENTANDINIYNDLMMGTQYGTGTASAAQVNQLLSIPLDATAATHVMQKLGQDFVVGVHLDTAPGWVRFGHTPPDGPTLTTLQIVIKYLP
jgi:hypothetical protein